MLNRRRLVITPCILGVALAIAGLGGCLGTSAIGTEYTLTIDRTLETHLPSELGTTHAIALEVLGHDLAYTVTDAGLDAREGVIHATTAKGHRVRVETYRRTENATQVQIYAGPGGHLATELAILNRIEARLPGRMTAQATRWY
jgi:hypothetical protein